MGSLADISKSGLEQVRAVPLFHDSPQEHLRLIAESVNQISRAGSDLFEEPIGTSGKIMHGGNKSGNSLTLKSNSQADGEVIFTGDYFQYGPTYYPASGYPANQSYWVFDKPQTANDCSILLRDQGNARAEIGLVGDNDIHIKTVSGTYPSETFTDRMLFKTNGDVEVYGEIFRKYGDGATSITGNAHIIAGNAVPSSSGAGMQLTYDFDNTQGHLRCVEWGNTYRQMSLWGNGIIFQLGAGSPSEGARFDPTGNLLIGGTTRATSSENTLHLFNSTAPTANATNGVVLYAEDVSASSELKVRDEAGNVTTLSPHNFELIPGGPSEDMSWSYYSERKGKKINVDMLSVIRYIEEISGKTFVYEA